MNEECEFLLKLPVKLLRWIYQDLFFQFATSISQDQKKISNTLVVYLFIIKFPGEKLPKVREVSGGNFRVGDSIKCSLKIRYACQNFTFWYIVHEAFIDDIQMNGLKKTVNFLFISQHTLVNIIITNRSITMSDLNFLSCTLVLHAFLFKTNLVTLM